MSDIIHLLPDSVANQIAAGEVIQRPASVIKELMENSIDAGATQIDVWVTDGGKTNIIVKDNGKGMSETDARLAFERHATSKITSAKDLFTLTTMGFRGEALPSIASVSQVELRTRPANQETGTLISIQGAKITEQKVIACNPGTQFKVSNLFFNIPARRRFLKSDTTEMNNILNEFERIALAHPSISFKFHKDETIVYDLRASSFKQRIVSIFGSNYDKNLLPIAVETGIVKIEGFIGTPASAKAKGAKQFFFINGRYMKHPYFSRAIMVAYDRLISSDKQVHYFCNLTVNPAEIDVNIHPQKTEIKFENEQAIWQILLASSKESLGRYNAIPSIDFTNTEATNIPTFHPDNNIPEPQIALKGNYDPFKKLSPLSGRATITNRNWDELYKDLATTNQHNTTDIQNSESTNPQEEITFIDLTENKVIKKNTFLQYKDSYIITPVKSGMMIINQHRAHIRILYDNYIKDIKHNTGVSQGLLFPELIQIPASQVTKMQIMMKSLSAVGFDISDMGGGSYAINGTPAGTGILNAKDFITTLLADNQNITKETIYKTIAFNLATQTAIKSTQSLNDEEIKHIIDALLSCQSPNYTPDGKITLTIISQDSIEKMF